MATRLKTVQFAFPATQLLNNNLQNLTQILVTLPETGTKTIRGAWVEVSMDDMVTATGGSLTTKTVNLRLGTAAYTSTTNANTLTNTGENLSFFTTRGFTSHFVANWTGTSMTCDVQLQINQSTGTTLGMTNVSTILFVTYEYDDTATTQAKTVHIPLNMPVTSLPTTKTAHDTIPLLNTYLPEASKNYLNMHIVVQGNSHQANTTDHSVVLEISSFGSWNVNFEAALATDRWTRYVWDVTSLIIPSQTETFNVWSTVAARHHSMQAWLVVTYEFNASTSTSIMNSLILPMEIPSPMGGTTSSDFQRVDREMFVEETNPVRQRLAAYVFWQATANETGLNARIGTGSFVAYTNTGSGSVAGNKGLMIRNDSPTSVPFGRGRNKLQLDIYNTSTTQRGGNVGAFWIINYTSDKHFNGPGAHNHTVQWPIYTEDTGAAVQSKILPAAAPTIPETNYFITGLGYEVNAMIGTVSQGISVQVERLASGEGGLVWESLYAEIGQSDNEMGLVTCYVQARSNFNRWDGDPEPGRLPLQTSRRYILNSGSAVAHWVAMTMFMTYHSITSTVAGTVSIEATGTLTVNLHRAGDHPTAPGELLRTTTRSGDGTYSFVWYDNTEEMRVVVDDGRVRGVSDKSLAVLDT